MSTWSEASARQDAGDGLKRFASRQARPARDDLAGAHAESPEIDGRDLPALLEERGNGVLAARVGPPFIPPLLFLRPAGHGNTKMFPRACLIQLREAVEGSQNGRVGCPVPIPIASAPAWNLVPRNFIERRCPQARAKYGITSRANRRIDASASARPIMPKLTCSDADSKPPMPR